MSEWLVVTEDGHKVRLKSIMEYGPSEYTGDKPPGYYKTYIKTRHNSTFPTTYTLEELDDLLDEHD